MSHEDGLDTNIVNDLFRACGIFTFAGFCNTVQYCRQAFLCPTDSIALACVVYPHFFLQWLSEKMNLVKAYCLHLSASPSTLVNSEPVDQFQ